jgi:predicted flap endonuclease-1-like 5' DNA nuclease
MGLSLDPHARTVENPIPLEIEHLDFSGAEEPENDVEMDQPETQHNPSSVELELSPVSAPVELPHDAPEEDLNFSDEIPDETAFVPETEENTQLASPVSTVVPLSLLQDEAETELAGMAPVEDPTLISAFDIDESKAIQTAPAPVEVVTPTSTPIQELSTELPPVSVPPLETVPFAAFTEANDDLTVVEGIGPKIQELLNQFGIKSYQQLAETDVNRLKEILSSAGSQLAMHDPGTWPAQANLAANDQWDNLKAIQGFLKGGKKPD